MIAERPASLPPLAPSPGVSRSTPPRVLGPAALTGLGLGGTIGAGIFVMSGLAAHDLAGPSVIVSFAVAGLVCLCAALCYAELSSRLPVAGSAYAYASAAGGRFFGWLVGWNVLLAYAVAGASVAQGWSHYGQALLGAAGVHLPAALSSGPFDLDAGTGRPAPTGAWLDLPALLVTLACTALLVRGVRTSVRANAVLVGVKLAVLALVLGVGAAHVHPANWHPFAPFGWGAAGAGRGMLAGAGLAFYAFLGFEAVSNYPEESRRPRRDVPIAIVASVGLCTLLYVGVAAVLTGLVPTGRISLGAPVSDAFKAAGLPWVAGLVAAGALTGISSVLLVLLLTLPRLLLALGRDRLLPARAFGELHPRFGTPWRATLVNGLVVAALASLLPLRALAGVITAATLLTFVVVACATLLLRRRPLDPSARNAFRIPGGPLAPLVSLAGTGLLCLSVPLSHWLQLAAWGTVGALIYAVYGRRQPLPGP